MKGEPLHLVKVRARRLGAEERARKTGHSVLLAGRECLYSETASLWVVEKVGVPREWKIRQSIVYEGTPRRSSQLADR